MISHTLLSQDFDHIITGYCKNRAGDRYVERGDYQVIRAKDNKRIGPLELAMVVHSGMVLEMSITLWQRTAFQENQHTCPRCRRINLNVPTTNGWIEWKVSLHSSSMHVEDVNYSYYCSVKFQVELSDTGRGDDEEISGKTATGDSQDRGGERDEERVEESYGEIISPASSVALFLFLEAANDDRWHSSQMRGTNTQREDEDPDPYGSNVQFFRRINVVYNNLPMSPDQGEFVPQQMYIPFNYIDQRRYVEEVQLDPPIFFRMENPVACGIPLMDALHSRVRRLQNRDETVLGGRGPSIY
jgi:hypothetical protein